jgi:YidC/Oxa1 family membrane protein insertase
VFIGLFYTLRTRLREDICPGLQAAFRHVYAAHHNIPLHEVAGQSVACHGLNGSSWLFIHDLTNTATGLTLVALIVLYVGTQLASSLMMQAPTMDQTQRRMLLLPLFFVIFIINFPAGLILYWITTNTWTMGQQWVIRRRIGPVGSVARSARAAAPGGRDGRRAAPADRDTSGAGGGLSVLLREKPEPEEKQPAAVGSSTRAPCGAVAASVTQEEAFRTPALAMGTGKIRVRAGATRANRGRCSR